MIAGAALELRDVQALRGGRALSDPVSLRCEPGTVLGLVGPNGAGKSSLLGAIAHTGVAAAGSVRFAGRDLAGLSARARAGIVSLLPQHAHAPDELRVGELVEVGARAARRPSAPDVAARALAELGIAELAGRRLATLSGGQRQLAHLARVRAQDAPVVLLDEPTTALDLGHQGTVERELRALAAAGRIVVAAMHDLSLALNACTSILLLDGDGGHHVGAPADILRPDLVHAVYGVRSSIHTTPGGRRVLTADDDRPDPTREEPR